MRIRIPFMQSKISLVEYVYLHKRVVQRCQGRLIVIDYFFAQLFDWESVLILSGFIDEQVDEFLLRTYCVVCS